MGRSLLRHEFDPTLREGRVRIPHPDHLSRAKDDEPHRPSGAVPGSRVSPVRVLPHLRDLFSLLRQQFTNPRMML